MVEQTLCANCHSVDLMQFSLENSKMLQGKCLSIKFKNILPIFVLIDLLKGGLN